MLGSGKTLLYTRPQLLLRLADFCGGTKALANIGALLRVAVSQIYGAGRGPLVYLDGCPCSASAVSAAGSASAAQPASPRCICRRQRLAQLQTPTKMHGARPPVRRIVSAARVARYPVKPLALSRFLRRAAAGACKNRSAAPAAAPCFVHWTRSPPLPFAHFSSRKVGALTTGRRESILVLNP